MKYLKKYNEDIDWDFDDEDENPIKEIPYIKNGISYGISLSEVLKINPLSNLNYNIKLEDKVVCIASDHLIKNKTGKIVDIHVQGGFIDYLIYFDEYIKGHDNNNIPIGHGWWVYEKYIKKI